MQRPFIGGSLVAGHRKLYVWENNHFLPCAPTTSARHLGISVVEEKFDPAVFLRVHRSNIINLRRVREAHRYGKSYDVTMENGDVVRVSRGYMDRLRDLTF